MPKSLKETLKTFSLPRILLDVPGSPTHLPKAAAALEELFAHIQPTPPRLVDLNETYTYLKKQWERGTPLLSMDKRHLRAAPWVIFDTHRPKVLAADVLFSEEYLRWLRARPRTSILFCLLFSFLKEYPTQVPSFSRWRENLKSLLSSLETLRMRRWLNVVSRCHLLEEQGPKRFAELILDDPAPVNEVLRSANLEGELENQGFSKHAYMEGLNMVECELSDGSLTMQRLERLMEWSEQPAGLRYPNEKALLAETLLRPFVRRPPVREEIKEKIKSFLLGHLGDPRIQMHRWFGVSEQSLQVMRSWMVEASLEYFFQVLDHTADPIWRYRKAFWGAFLDRGYISEAWPILGRRARDAINRAMRETAEKTPYGTLQGVEASQSVLVMTIGTLLIAEWSHNGRCRVWHLENGTSQSLRSRWLYNIQAPVSAEELRRSADFELVHRGSEQGGWQRKLYDHIHRYTGVQIPFSHMMPRGGL